MSIPFEPSILTTPVPLGVSGILALDVDTRPLPYTSKSPPSGGDVSATTSVIPPRPDDNVASVIVASTLMSIITIPIVVFYSLIYFQ